MGTVLINTYKYFAKTYIFSVSIYLHAVEYVSSNGGSLTDLYPVYTILSARSNIVHIKLFKYEMYRGEDIISSHDNLRFITVPAPVPLNDTTVMVSNFPLPMPLV